MKVTDGVHMNRKSFVDEHEDLTKILKSGSKKERKEEYDEQSQELKGVKAMVRKKGLDRAKK